MLMVAVERCLKEDYRKLTAEVKITRRTMCKVDCRSGDIIKELKQNRMNIMRS